LFSYRALSHDLFVSFRRPPRSTLIPYTTLFRSSEDTSYPPSSTAARTSSSAGSSSSSSSASAAPTIRMQRSLNHVQNWRNVLPRSEEHTSELQSRENLVCRLLLEKKKKTTHTLD